MTRKLLITGINGFLGSNCAKYFSKNFEIFGIDVVGSGKNFLQDEVSRKNLEQFNVKFDVIIHLAGSGTVGDATKDPEGGRIKTVESTREVLEYIKNHNQNAKLIYSSSAAVYGNLYNRPIKEAEISEPISFYGKHRLEVEKMCEKYYNDFGLNINIIRFFSIYGEGLQKQLLWDFLNRAQKGIFKSFGTGNEIRDFIHINDAISFIEILMKEDGFSIFNCASGEGFKIREILEKVCANFGCVEPVIFDNISQEGNPNCLIADIEKAKGIGFLPKVALDEGIEKYVEWFKKRN